MNAQGPTPPGWYPDSEGALRWYDGTAWTEHTQASGPPPAAPPPSGGGRHRGPLIAVIVAAVLLVAGAATALVLVLGSDDDDSDDPGAEPATSATNAPTDEPTAPSEPSEPTEPGVPDPDESPEAVVRTFVDASVASNCALAEELVTPELLEREGGCNPEDLGGSDLEGVTFDVGKASIEGQSATVPVTITVEGADLGPDSEFAMGLVRTEDGWRIDRFDA